MASPFYVAAHVMPNNLQDLAGHDCLTGSNPQRPVVWVLHGPNGVEEVRVSGRFSANSSRVLTKSCVAGIGIAMLPTMLIAPDLRAGRLVRVLPDYRRDGADFNVVLPSRQQIPAAVSAFIEFVTERLRSMVTNTECEPKPASRRRSTR